MVAALGPAGGGDRAGERSFDGTTRRLYLDGVEVDSDVAVPTLYDLDPVRIGCDRDGGVLAFRFGGEIDDVRLYDRVLDQDEIAQLAQ